MNGHRREQHEIESGFTLIELLISIVVVGILTAVAIVGIAGLQEKGQTAACATSLDAAKSATEIYYSITGGKFPQTFADLTNPPTGGSRCSTRRRASSSRRRRSKARDGGWTVTLVPGATAADRTTFSRLLDRPELMSIANRNAAGEHQREEKEMQEQGQERSRVSP